MTTRTTSPTQRAIRQEKPFSSLGQEAVIALWIAADHVRRPFETLLAHHGELTLQQYNVLRILRGAGERGLPTLDIAERMIERTPGITRLVDRLEKKGLVERQRSTEDRRQVVVRLTRAGRDALTPIDRAIDKLDAEVLGKLNQTELKQLLKLLERVFS
jgi:DNA-binding MarR family transcriptional regulator